MSIENYKRDRNTLAIVAVNKEDINTHRSTIHQRNLLHSYLNNQSDEIRLLKNELTELKNIIINLVKNQDNLGKANGN